MICETTKRKKLSALTASAYAQNKRLVAPLAGFPGCDLLGVPIKTAQQNHGLHYSCIEAMVHNFKPDAAFMMMDLSVEANALGLAVRFPTHESSTVEYHPVKKVEDLDQFRCVNIMQDARIQSYVKTIEMMRMGFPDNVLVGAYIIGPLTLAGLLTGAQQVAMDSVLEPEKLDIICKFCTSVILEYAQALVTAGADMICVLEPTGSILGPEQFEKFSCRYVSHICESYKYSGVDTIYHVCGNTMHLLDGMVASGVNALSLDSPEAGIDLAKVAQKIPSDVVVVGNVNPTEVIQSASVDEVKRVTKSLLEDMKDYPNFLLSTACDLPPGTPLENIRAFVQTAREYRP